MKILEGKNDFINHFLTNLSFSSCCGSFAGRHVAAVAPVFDSADSVVVKNVPKEAVRQGLKIFRNLGISGAEL